MLLYTNPELLRLLLIPNLNYAANKTYIKFTDPYSPHQLGTYPIGDATTAAQLSVTLKKMKPCMSQNDFDHIPAAYDSLFAI